MTESFFTKWERVIKAMPLKREYNPYAETYCPYCGADEPSWNGTHADPEWHALVEKQDAEIEQLRAAIRITAGQGTYNEMAIRKAVSFELAELIVAERQAIEATLSAC